MTDDQAIKEMKKAERIFTKLSRNGFCVSIQEGILVMNSNAQHDANEERINNFSSEAKEWALSGKELYTMEL